MKFERVFITGGTGYIGKSLLDYRLRHPAFLVDTKFVFLSRNPDAFCANNKALIAQPGISFISGDIRDFSFPRGDFDAIINAASPVLGAASDEETISVNVEGAKRVLEFAKGNFIKRLLFTSSGAVYTKQSRPLLESDECKPATAYGKAKLIVEQLLSDSGIPVGIARIFAQVGKYVPRDAHYAIGNFIQMCIDGDDIVIKSDGSPIRSFQYSDDAIEWLYAIFERGVSGRPYNVGSEDAISIRDLALYVREILQSHNAVRIVGAPVQGVANYYVPNVTNAKSELKLINKFNLKQAILESAR